MKNRALILFATLALSGCLDKTATPQEYEVPEFVEVKSEVSRVSGEDVVQLTAVLSNSSGVEQSGFSFGKSLSDMLKMNAPLSKNSFTLQMSGLQADTEYRFYAWAGNGNSEIRSSLLVFKTNKEDVLEPVVPPTPPPQGEGITISDPVFRKYLLELADANSDGKIEADEAAAILSMEFNTDEIENLDGIQYFPNLKSLVCCGSVWNGLLEELLVQQNTALETLDCSYNRIEELRGSASLRKLVCRFNKLGTLDLRYSPSLTSLDCFGNSLEKLDLSPVPELEELVCGMNAFETLDVSCCHSLRLLDLTDSPMLKTVYVARGQTIETIIADNSIRFKYIDQQ